MAKPRKLIHLGLHKTGTTLLQELWSHMPDVSRSKEFSIKTAYILRDIIWGHSEADFHYPEGIPVYDFPGEGEDPFLVHTAENLSNPTLSDFSRERLDIFHRYTPEVFSQLVGGEAQVLLMVREPRSWLKSLYKQYLHEGGSLTFKRYLVVNEEALAYILSLEPILAPWREFYGADNVTILPYELMRDDMDAFAAALHQATGMPTGRFTDDIRLNVSVTDAQAEMLREAARLMKLYIDNMPVSPETADQLKQNAVAISDMLRTQMQQSPNGRMAKIARRTGLTLDTDVTLPPKIREAVEAGFLPTVKAAGGALEPYLELYGGALD